MLYSRTLPVCLVGLFAAVTVGCVGARDVNTRLYGPTQVPALHTDAPDIVVADEQVIDDFGLAYAPVGVQAAFRTEHPDAGATTVETIPAGGGRLAYAVSYIDDAGRPQTELYSPRGRDLTYKPTQVHYADWREEAYGLRVRFVPPAARPAEPATRPSSDTTAR